LEAVGRVNPFHRDWRQHRKNKGDRITATKRNSPKSKSEVVTEEKGMIDREVFDWGVRLTAHPFRGTANHAMIISSEIRNYRAGRGAEVYITFPAFSLQKPMRLIDARTWHAALGAIIKDTQAVQTEMRTTVGKKKS